MTNRELHDIYLLFFYPYLLLLLVNYAWFLPRAYRDLKNKRPTHATKKVYWACGIGAFLTVVFGLSMATPWRGTFGFIWFFLNFSSIILVGHLWQRHQILSNPSHPLHELYSSMIMKGKD
jgi:hypothetical protein